MRMPRHAWMHAISLFSLVQIFETLWIVAHQTPLSMGFSRQEYCTGFPSLLQGIVPEQGLYLASLASPASARRFFTTSTSRGKSRSKEWKEKKSEEVIWVPFTSWKFLPPLVEPVHLLKSICILCLLKPRLSYSSSSLSVERMRKGKEKFWIRKKKERIIGS